MISYFLAYFMSLLAIVVLSFTISIITNIFFIKMLTFTFGCLNGNHLSYITVFLFQEHFCIVGNVAIFDINFDNMWELIGSLRVSPPGGAKNEDLKLS